MTSNITEPRIKSTRAFQETTKTLTYLNESVEVDMRNTW